MKQITISEFLRTKKQSIQKYIDANDHNSDYWRGFKDSLVSIEQVLENSKLQHPSRLRLSLLQINVDDDGRVIYS